MKVSLPRKPFAAALKAVVSPTRGVSGTPVLSGVRIEAAEDGQVTLTCTNLDVTVSARIDADRVTAPGVIIPPAVLLSKLVDSFSDDGVGLEADRCDAQSLSVASGNAVADLRTLPVVEWPAIDPPPTDGVELDVDVIERIGRTLRYASVDTSKRAELQGVHFEGKAAWVTDSYRAAIVEVDADLPEVTIPAGALASVFKLSDGPVRVATAKSIVSIVGDRVQASMRVLEGDYPRVEGLWRESSPHRFTFGAAAMIEALGRLNAIRTSVGIPIVAECDGDRLRLSFHENDVGSVVDEIHVDGSFDGRFGFNPVFLSDLVDVAHSDDVTLEADTAMKPVMVRSERLRQFLMPIRLPQ